MQISQLVQVSGKKGRREAFCCWGADPAFSSSHNRATSCFPSFLPLLLFLGPRNSLLPVFLLLYLLVLLSVCVAVLLHLVHTLCERQGCLINLFYVMDPFGKPIRAMESLPKKMHIVYGQLCSMFRTFWIPNTPWQKVNFHTSPCAAFSNHSGQRLPSFPEIWTQSSLCAISYCTYLCIYLKSSSF